MCAGVGNARGRTTTVVGRGEKGSAMGAYSDTPSSRQVADLLREVTGLMREVKQLNRTADRIQEQLSSAGLALYFVGLLSLTAGVLYLFGRAAAS